MIRFEFKVTKIENDGNVLKHRIGIYADNKIEAVALLTQIFPNTDYEYEFVETCQQQITNLEHLETINSMKFDI